MAGRGCARTPIRIDGTSARSRGAGAAGSRLVLATLPVVACGEDGPGAGDLLVTSDPDLGTATFVFRRDP